MNRYTNTCVYLVNAVFLFVALNAVLYIGQSSKDKWNQSPLYQNDVIDNASPYVQDRVVFYIEQMGGIENLLRAHEGLTESELIQLCVEQCSMSLEFEPFVNFKESVICSPFMRVNHLGYREIEGQREYTEDRKTVFLFGGSTQFGYGLPYDQTIGSYLQRELGDKCDVFNFGRAYYTSTQERILLESLLLKAFIPDVVVFLDGLNNSLQVEKDPICERFRNAIAQANSEPVIGWAVAISSLPVKRGLDSFCYRVLGLKNTPPKNNAGEPDYAAFENRLQFDYAAIDNLSKEYGFKVIKAIQPIPTYHYPRLSHFLGDKDFSYYEQSNFYYEGLVKAKWVKDKAIVWLAEIQDRRAENLYVDQCHYTADFCREIATHLSQNFERF